MKSRSAVRSPFWPGAIVVVLLLLASGVARAQGLAVLPVNIQMAPGQAASTLTVSNRGDSATSIQVRVYAWNQPNGDRLDATDEVIASPPLATIPAGGSQVVRLLLRRPPLGREATYRILLDQIPPPASPGTVRVVLRLSIPIFAEPPARVAPDVRWRVEDDAGQAYLVGTNIGTRHETVRNIVLVTAGKVPLKVEANVSPYILAGATRRWRIVASGALPAPETSVHLSAHTDTGTIDETLAVAAGP